MENFEYIQKTYNEKAECGRVVKVKATGEVGTIVGTDGEYLIVVLDRNPTGRKYIYYPGDVDYMEINMGWKLLLSHPETTDL